MPARVTLSTVAALAVRRARRATVVQVRVVVAQRVTVMVRQQRWEDRVPVAWGAAVPTHLVVEGRVAVKLKCSVLPAMSFLS